MSEEYKSEPQQCPHPLYSVVPSGFGILALLAQFTSLLGFPGTWIYAIKVINYVSAQKPVGHTKIVGDPNYIAFSLTGFCVTQNNSTALTSCQTDYNTSAHPLPSL